MANQSHETLQSFRDISPSSNRKFGLIVGGIFCVLALVPLILHRQTPRYWMLAPGLALVVLGMVAPGWLAPVNTLWTKLGLLLGKITNPIVMGVLFFAVMFPIGLLLRAFGKDLLRLRRDPAATTYWIDRDTAAPLQLTKQF